MMEDAAAQLERDHVHSVYDQIAPYFNDIRYKAWPKVRQFLLDQPPGSLVADVGCGNGKYLNINKEVFKLGCDVCRPLVDFAWSQGHEVQMCDGLHLPYRDGCFDAVLSIAVIHHLSTKERRIRAIKEMARALRVGGRIMIYVWAMEQKRRKFEKQDIFVPWNPNPLSPPHGGPRARAGAQSAGDPAADHADKHRKVKSTSSVMDGDGLRGACAGPQQKSQRLWFFSRSLDSVFDFGSLAISRSSSRDLSSLSSRSGEQEGGAGRWYRGRGLIKQVSSFFSAAGSEEDVFESRQKEAGDENARAGPKKRSVPPAMVQGFGSEALPDLVPSQKECAKAPGDGGEGGDPEVKWGERRGSRESPEEGERPPMGPCLRYYHVFREGELAELIDRHVEELHVTNSYFDHANWCVVAEKIQVWKI